MAFPWNEVPDYLIRIATPAYVTTVKQRLAAMDIPITRRPHDHPGRMGMRRDRSARSAGMPRSQCHLRRAHLAGSFAGYTGYHKELRTHLSLDKDSQPVGRSAARPACRSPIPADFTHQYWPDVVCGRNTCVDNDTSIVVALDAWREKAGIGQQADERENTGAFEGLCRPSSDPTTTDSRGRRH